MCASLITTVILNSTTLKKSSFTQCCESELSKKYGSKVVLVTSAACGCGSPATESAGEDTEVANYDSDTEDSQAVM